MVRGLGILFGSSISFLISIYFKQNLVLLSGLIMSIMLSFFVIILDIVNKFKCKKKNFLSAISIGFLFPLLGIFHETCSLTVNAIIIGVFGFILSHYLIPIVEPIPPVYKINDKCKYQKLKEIVDTNNLEVNNNIQYANNNNQYVNNNNQYVNNNNQYVNKPDSPNFIIREGYHLINNYMSGDNFNQIEEVLNNYETNISNKDKVIWTLFLSYKKSYNKFVKFLENSRDDIIAKNISVNFNNENILKNFGNIVESNELLVEAFENIKEDENYAFVYNTSLIKQAVQIFLKNAISIYAKYVNEYYKYDKNMWKENMFDANILMTKINSTRILKLLPISEEFNNIIKI